MKDPDDNKGKIKTWIKDQGLFYLELLLVSLSLMNNIIGALFVSGLVLTCGFCCAASSFYKDYFTEEETGDTHPALKILHRLTKASEDLSLEVKAPSQ